MQQQQVIIHSLKLKISEISYIKKNYNNNYNNTINIDNNIKNSFFCYQNTKIPIESKKKKFFLEILYKKQKNSFFKKQIYNKFTQKIVIKQIEMNNYFKKLYYKINIIK